VAHTCNPTWEAEIRKMAVWSQLGQIVPVIPISKNQSKMDWRSGSSGRVQAQSIEFKTQAHKRKK
jgi:hypothetical protein